VISVNARDYRPLQPDVANVRAAIAQAERRLLRTLCDSYKMVQSSVILSFSLLDAK